MVAQVFWRNSSGKDDFSGDANPVWIKKVLECGGGSTGRKVEREVSRSLGIKHTLTRIKERVEYTLLAGAGTHSLTLHICFCLLLNTISVILQQEEGNYSSLY